MNKEDDILFDMQGLADYLGLSLTATRARAWAGKFPFAVRMGKLYRFWKSDTDQWLESLKLENAVKVQESEPSDISTSLNEVTE